MCTSTGRIRLQAVSSTVDIVHMLRRRRSKVFCNVHNISEYGVELQIGKAVGAHVIAVARGRHKCAVLEDLGADLVIDSAALKEPLRVAIKSVAPKGMHLGFLAYLWVIVPCVSGSGGRDHGPCALQQVSTWCLIPSVAQHSQKL